MTEPAPRPAPHAVTFTPDGATGHTHPDPDHPDCDFATYIAGDFPDPHELMYGRWLFYWVDGHWYGTPEPEET